MTQKHLWIRIGLCALALGACGRLEHIPAGADTTGVTGGSVPAGSVPTAVGTSSQATPPLPTVSAGGASIVVTNPDGTEGLRLDATEQGGASMVVTNPEGTEVVRLDAPTGPDAAANTETADAFIIEQSTGMITYDCVGKRVEVRGDTNSITLTGDCLALDVVGNQNAITIDRVATITTTGNTNAVTWKAGRDGQDPVIHDTGTMNVISQEE